MAATVMKVRLCIDKKLALLAGNDTHGPIVINVPAADLSQEDRETLSRYGSSNDSDYDLVNPDNAWTDWTARQLIRGDQASMDRFKLASASTESLVAFLTTVRELDKEVAEYRVKEVAEKRAKWEAKVADFLAADVASFIQERSTDLASKVGNDYIYSPKPYISLADGRLKDDPRCADKLAQVYAELEHRLATAKATHEAKIADAERRLAEQGRRAEESAARLATQVANWVEEHGTEEQQRRHAAGFLPDDEVRSAIRASVFDPIGGFAAYQKINKGDVCECDYDDDVCEFSVEVSDADALTAQEFQDLTTIRALLPAATVTPRVHEATTSECDCSEERKSLYVKVVVGEFTLTKELALPLVNA